MKLHFHKGNRNGLLLVTLLVVLVFAPFLEKGAITRYAFNIMLTLVMVSGALSAAQSHGRFKLVGIALAVALLIGFLISRSQLSAALPILRVLEILFLMVVAASILAQAFTPGPATLNKIFGALSVYLLFGLVLGLTCLLLESVVPGSFRGAEGRALDGADMVYFGYVTLTTLGYGDIVPVTAKARSFAMLGAIVGPLYVAVLIARLISDYGGERDEDLSADPSGGE